MKIELNASLRPYNTFGIDALCHRLITLEIGDEAEMQQMSQALEGEDFLVLGGGSNMVFTRDYPGTVVLMRGKALLPSGQHADGGIRLYARAGENWSNLVEHCLEKGWHGLENLAGIPGTVGASAVQNIGAYGIEAKDVIDIVEAYDTQERAMVLFEAGQCRYGYRDSIFKHCGGRYIVCGVTYHLQTAFSPNLSYRGLSEALAKKGIVSPTARQVADTVVELRNSKLPDPSHVGSAGSFFKNPVILEDQRNELLKKYPSLVSFPAGDGLCKLAAGWMIEQCGWKGRSLGRAGVWEKQALVLCNRGGCTGQEVKALAEAIQKDVRERFGVELEPEAIFV